KSFIDKGMKVVVDNSFKAYEIQTFASENASLITVIGEGFASYEVKSFIDKGVEVVVDNSIASYEIKSFISKNASLVTVIGKGFTAYEIKFLY
ncbi:MAG: hypothetical protein MK226_23440, partial [Saprospiraceae bacterium]|nr:hypothetical protein [Saprospiraceae bacterium]